MSNGGSMTVWLAFNLPKIWAAIAAVGSNMLVNVLTARSLPPIPFVGMHGTADPLSPCDGGEVASGQGVAKSTAWTMNFWATVNDCNLTPAITNMAPTVNDGTNVDQYTYTNSAGQIRVVYYVVQGMGHQWPPSEVISDLGGPTSLNINATDVIWDFFSNHSRQLRSTVRSRRVDPSEVQEAGL